jgi:hypothetical protein
MQRLSVKLQLACGERELHLQRRINWAEWRPVRSVRGRKVQVVDRICRLLGLYGRVILWGHDLFLLYSSRGQSKIDMHRLPVKQHIALWEHSFD